MGSFNATSALEVAVQSLPLARYEQASDARVTDMHAVDASNLHPVQRVRSADPELHRFISMTAHELREPIHAIQGFLSVMLRDRVGVLNTVQHDFLSSAYLAGRRLERLVDDLQILVVGERAFPISSELTDVYAHAMSCARELAPIAEGYDVAIAVEVRGAGPWSVWCDPVRIDQVMLNVMENAIRYSSTGSTIRVRLRTTAASVQVTVHNQVDVAPSEDPRRWFTPFARGAESATQPGGLGLGLAVAEHLIQRHGGHVSASARGRSVAIQFVLPRNDTPSEMIRATPMRGGRLDIVTAIGQPHAI